MANKEPHNPLDEKIHDAFSELEVTPSPEVWRNVEIELDKEKKRKPGYWIWFGAGGLSLLLLGMGIWYFASSAQTQNTPPVSNTISKNTVRPIENGKSDTSATSANSNTVIIASAPKDTTKIVKVNNPNIAPQDKQPNATTNEKKKTATVVALNKPLENEGNKKNTTITAKPIVIVPSANQQNENKKSPETPQVNTPMKKVNETKTEVNNVTSIANTPATKKEPITEATTTTTTKKENATEPVNNLAIASKSNAQKAADSSVSKPSVKKTDSVKKAVTNTIQAKADTTSTAKTKTPPIFSLAGFYSQQLEKNQVLSNNGNLDLNNDKPGTSYNAGIKVGLSLGSRIEVTAGVSYSRFSLNSSSNGKFYFPRYLTQPYTFNGAYGDMVVPLSTMYSGFSLNAPPAITSYGLQYQYTQTMSYVNFPIDVRLNFNMHKFKFYISTGVIVQDAISTSAILTLIKETETDQLNYSNLNVSKVNFSVKGSIGIEYDFLPHFGVFIEPDATRGITSYTTPEVKSTAYFLGCNGGIKIYF